MKIKHVMLLIVWPSSLGLLALVTGILGASAALAQVPVWPTPLPAPIGTFPRVISSSEITPVPAATSPGSIALQVDPIFAGPVPRIPPRASTTILTGEPSLEGRIAINIDAGAIDRTIQLTYQPLSVDQVPNAGPSRPIQRAFQLQTYDHTASVLDTAFKYPVRITLHVNDREVAASGDDPARLFLARFDAQNNRWLPLVTTYRSTESTLLVRVLRPGIFAVIAQPAPVLR